MSAYIVEDTTINKIVAFLVDQQENGNLHSINFYGLPSWTPLVDEEQKAEFAQSLFDMNVKSVKQRYGEGHQAIFGPFDFKYERVWPLNPTNAYKSLRCFLYQSCEGDVNKTDLYKLMHEISNRMAHSIVHSSKAWEDAPWG